MLELSIIVIILFIILSITLIFIYKKQYNKLKNNFHIMYYERNKEQYDNLLEKIKKDYLLKEQTIKQDYENKEKELLYQKNLLEQSLIDRKKAIEDFLIQLEIRKREAEKTYQEKIASEKEKIEIEAKAHHDLLMSQAASLLKEEQDSLKREMEQQLADFLLQCNAARQEKQAELDTIILQLEDFRKKQEVINADIIRRRKVEEDRDYYRVVLTEDATQDIQILLSVREKLLSRENLDKLIYDVYISKPVMEMTKRILNGRAPSGIYKITRLKTGEIYIGKSTDIKKRWTEHCKTAFGVGAIAHSILHTTIKRDGIENFTFELIEEVPKEKLSEREKYWINYYDSKNYGLNEKVG